VKNRGILLPETKFVVINKLVPKTMNSYAKTRRLHRLLAWRL